MDSEHWQTYWPLLVPTLSGLVVFGDRDGSIGTGCIRELADAWRWDLPVALLDLEGRARRIRQLTLRPDLIRDPWRTVSLVQGRVVDLARLMVRPAQEGESND